MSEQQPQVSKMAGALVEHQRAFEVMSIDERQWVIMNTKEAIGLFVEAVKNRAEVKVEMLFKFIRLVSFPAIPKFVVAEKFREGETVDGINVAWLGPNLKANFLKKVEPAIPAIDMQEHELCTRSRDPAIIIKLGGEGRVETTLGQFWESLKTADQTLVHIRHIRDENGVLWAVEGFWFDGGLHVEASPLAHPDDWSVGFRFLSR